MPEYSVTLTGLYSEEWVIVAASPEDAAKRVRDGEGHFAGGEWVDGFSTSTQTTAEAGMA